MTLSQPLFHASLSFAISAIILKLDAQLGQLAFAAAMMSVLMDIDIVLSPTRHHETALHSPSFLIITFLMVPAMLFASLPLSIAVMPAVACVTHIAQDIMQGEQVRPGMLTRLVDVNLWHRPEIGRALDLISLPLALLAMLV